VLELLQHENFHIAYRFVHNMQLLKAFWSRQAALIGMKTKSRSLLNVEDEFIMYWASNYSFFIYFPLLQPQCCIALSIPMRKPSRRPSA